MIILTLIGPEYRGRRLEVAYDNDMEEAAGQGTLDLVKRADDTEHRNNSDEIEKV